MKYSNVRAESKTVAKSLAKQGIIPISMENYIIDEIMRENY
jgi:hypothetical protein